MMKGFCPLNNPSPTDKNIELLRDEIKQNQNDYNFRVIKQLKKILQNLEDQRNIINKSNLANNKH